MFEPNLRSNCQNVVVAPGNYVIDASQSNYFSLSISGTTHLAIANLIPGQFLTVETILAGANTVDWAGTGAAPAVPMTISAPSAPSLVPTSTKTSTFVFGAVDATHAHLVAGILGA